MYTVFAMFKCFGVPRYFLLFVCSKPFDEVVFHVNVTDIHTRNKTRQY